jgi:hypothetical protein
LAASAFLALAATAAAGALLFWRAMPETAHGTVRGAAAPVPAA